MSFSFLCLNSSLLTFFLNEALKLKYPSLSITKVGRQMFNSHASIRRDCPLFSTDKHSGITQALFTELISNQNEASLSMLLTNTTRKLSTFL
jgi:hypothetical protein